MRNKPFATCIIRLLALCIMLGGLLILSNDEKVYADSCDTQYGECIFANCTGLSENLLFICTSACASQYESCKRAGLEEELPGCLYTRNPTYTQCMINCRNNCLAIPNPDAAIQCYLGCRPSCGEPWKATCPIN